MVFETNFEVSKTIGLYFTPKSWKLNFRLLPYTSFFVLGSLMVWRHSCLFSVSASLDLFQACPSKVQGSFLRGRLLLRRRPQVPQWFHCLSALPVSDTRGKNSAPHRILQKLTWTTRSASVHVALARLHNFRIWRANWNAKRKNEEGCTLQLLWPSWKAIGLVYPFRWSQNETPCHP